MPQLRLCPRERFRIPLEEVSMQAPRATFTFVMLLTFSVIANAQSGGVRFSSLPAAAQSSIYSTLAGEIPDFSGEQLAKLTASDGQSGVGFGVSIAISGDTVVVGISVNYLHELMSSLNHRAAGTT
jgi:hypothetical protein